MYYNEEEARGTEWNNQTFLEHFFQRTVLAEVKVMFFAEVGPGAYSYLW